jgi:hypothetical protein
MTPTAERRKKTRAAAELDLTFDVSGRSGLARVRDISASGVRCVTDRPMPLMTQVALVIRLPKAAGAREISCRGAVVRSAPAGRDAAFETAIFFTHMSDADRIDVEDFVSSVARPR